MISDHRLWFGTDSKSKAMRIAALPAAWLYEAGWTIYRLVYDLGLKQPQLAHPKVLCVGNLTVGGSGKSPLTIYLATKLKEVGGGVVISCSGYGSPASERAQLAPAGPLDPRQWGDEPAMIRWMMPEIPLIIGRDRVLAAQIAFREFPSSIFLMDDGFQHLPLKKTLSIIIDEPNPVNRWCLPAGPYREPRRNRKRASMVLPSDGFHISSKPIGFIDPFTGNPIERISEPAEAVCAIARPDRFLDNLREVGVQIAKTYLHQDHFKYPNLKAINGVPKTVPIITTAKDWVKIQSVSGHEKWRWIVAMKEVSVEPEGTFIHWLRKNIGA